jgi:alkylation response protein AidB-like acyl-CoA dehydrogenase
MLLMQFALTDEQKHFVDSVRRFAAKFASGALERAHNPGFPFDVAQQMAAQGLLGITLPEEDGGQGGTLMHAVLAIEQVAIVCPRSADVIQAGNFGPLRTFAAYATPEQKRRWLPDLLSGRSVISLGMTEPGAGSAVTDLETAAEADGSGYILNGTKIFSTHSTDASLFLLYVRFAPGIDGIGSVLVERGAPGFKMGPRPCSWAESSGRNCISTIAASLPTRFCLVPAVSGSRCRLSMSSGSETRRDRLRSVATPTMSRGSMQSFAGNSEDRCASFRVFSGCLRIWR